MKFKPYEKYKKVALPWIDEVPSHWEVTRLKRILSENQSGNWGEEPLNDKNDIYVLRSTEQTEAGKWRVDWTNVAVRNIENMNMKNILKKNDLLFTKSSGSFNHIGKVSIVNEDIEQKRVTFSNFMQKLKVRENVSAYFYWLILNSKFVKQQYRTLSTTTTGLSNLNLENINNIVITLPPKEEQDKIVDFLDYNLGKIDKFIELRETQIELLKEQKEVIINYAVTKGIDKTVEYKNSGIDWIGEIPKHWEVTRFKYLLEKGKNNIKVGPFGSQLKNSDLTTKGKWVYNQRTVLDKNFLTNSSFISENKYNELIGFKVEKDDILITTRGSIGKICKIPADFQEGVIHPCIIKFRLDEKKYIYKLLDVIFNESEFIKNQISILSNTTTIDVIYSNSLKNIFIPLPPLSEQKQIVDYIEEEISKIDRTIELYKNQIELIKEYRTSLIASAVTGKIDVRDF